MSLELFAIIFFDYLPDFPYIGSGFQLRFILYFDANFVIRTVNAISFAVKNNFFAGFKNIKLKVRDIGKITFASKSQQYSVLLYLKRNKTQISLCICSLLTVKSTAEKRTTFEIF